jgi:hypothetical protein
MSRKNKINEHMVPSKPRYFSLKDWLKHKVKNKITNKEYADEVDGDQWRVVHGKNRPERKGKGGRKLKPTKRGGRVTQDASYKKTLKRHTAIKLSEQQLRKIIRESIVESLSINRKLKDV